MDNLVWTADLITYTIITGVALSLLLGTLLLGEVFEFLDSDDSFGPAFVNSTLMMATGVGFGAVGWIITATTDLNGLATALIAAVGGLLMGVPLGMVQAAMHRAQGSTDLSHNELTGRIGIVQLPTHPDLAGMVEIPSPDGSTVTLPARGGNFKVGDRVKIVEIVASTAFVEAP